MMNGYPWDAGDWLAMILMMVLVWGALIAAVVWVARSLRGPRGGTSNAEAELAARFVRGEIDADAFVRGRELIRSAPAPATPLSEPGGPAAIEAEAHPEVRCAS
jgi:uncharacterized membrane protein